MTNYKGLFIDRTQVLNSAKWSSPGKNNKTVIVLHETANTSPGADAYAHHRLQYNGNPRQASWHYTTDEHRAVQSFNENLRLWHSGAVAVGFTIAIEVCVNGDKNKAWRNAILLATEIAERNNITPNNIVTHKFYTGKNCPTFLLSGRLNYTYNSVIKAIENGTVGKVESKPTEKPKVVSKSISVLADEVIAGKHGNGADRMNSLGSKYGAVQNEINKRLGKSTSGAKKKQDLNYKQMATEIIAGVHGNGHANRQKKLGLTNAQYEKVRKEVNRLSGTKVNTSQRSIDSMARLIINDPQAPTGVNNRAKWLGISNAQMRKVQNRINQLL